MHRILPILFFLISFCVLSPARLIAQEDSATFQHLSLRELLNVKITTAGKLSQSSELASAVVTVITKEQIKARGYQSLLDVMYDLKDVKVDDKMYSGIRNSFTIRGTQGSEKFVILLDGINISSPSGEAMPIMQNYPVHLAEQIEILYGPASALYGANAMSGVVNIITRKNVKKDLVAEISSTAGDYGYTNTTLFITKQLSNKVHLIVSGQYYYDRSPDYSKLYAKDTLLDITSHRTGTFNSIYGPFTPVAPLTPKFEAPMKAYNIFASLRAEDFSFNYFRNQFTTPNAFENNPANTIYNKNVSSTQSITVANATYKKTFNRLTSTTMLTTSKYNLDPKSNYRNVYTAMEPGYKYSTTSMTKMEQQADYKFSEKLDISGGVGYENYESIPQSADLEAPVNTHFSVEGVYLGSRSFYKPDGLQAHFYLIKFNNIGSFFQVQYSPASKINITLGARYDKNSRYGSSFNPRVGIVSELSENTTVKLLYGSAFRAPSPSDSYVQYGSFVTYDSGRNYQSHFLHLPNPGLKPIRSYNTELNILQRLSDDVVLTIDGYYTILTGLYGFANDNESTRLYNNMFNGMPVDYIEVFVNRQKQKNYGGSVQVNWKNDIGDTQMSSFASVSYVNGVVNAGADYTGQATKDMQLEFISPFMMRLGTDITTGKFSFSPRLTVAGKQHIAGTKDGTGDIVRRQTIAGYSLLNLSMRYIVSKHISVYTNISNALNQRYRNVSFNMDQAKQPTELYYGNHQDPIRFMTGIHLTF
jgi:outer membrane receptor protein involved in Fe transport